MNHRERQEAAGLWYLLGACWAIWSLLLGMLATAGEASWPLSERRTMLLLFLLVYHLPELCSSVWWYWARSQSKTPHRVTPRPTLRAQLWRLVSYIPIALVLIFTFDHTWTLADVGLTPSLRWEWAIVIGYAMGRLYFQLIQGLEERSRTLALARKDEIGRRVLRRWLPRGRLAQAIGVLNTSTLGPVFEELVYRGFLVLLLASVCESHAWGIFSGLMLFWLMHLYQGPAQQFSQLIWIVLTLLLLYSPFGLPGVIAMHITHNSYCVLAIRHEARRLVHGRQRAVVMEAASTG